METPESEGLSKAEDDSLRRLKFFSDNAGISEWTRDRIASLRTHDRRRGIRAPRDEPLTVEDPENQDPA